MSRRWERMVEKNKQQMNKVRSKRGETLIGKDGPLLIRGRSWVFPAVLVVVAYFFATTMPAESKGDPLFIVTIALYVLLALIHFVFRRPFLKIGKSQLSWRTYTGEKYAPVGNIASIQIDEKQSVVHLKDGSTRKFTKLYQLFPMAYLNNELAKFADQHRIPLYGAVKEQ